MFTRRSSTSRPPPRPPRAAAAPAGRGRGRQPPLGLDSVRAALMSPDTVTALADTFKVLGDPTRVRILDAIARQELCVNDLSALVGLSESAVSHQLRLLRGLRLVRPRRSGRQVFYTLDDQHIMSLFQQGLRHVQEGPPPGRSIGRTET